MATAFARADAPPDPLRDVDLVQKLGAALPLDARFKDDTGRDVALGEYFTGRRPAVLVLAYYDCPMLCTLVLNGVTDSLQGVSLVPGRDFDVVVISIDPSEGPALAARKKRSYVSLYGKNETASGWHFLTGREPDIHAVADAVGFRYLYDQASRQWAHPAGIMVIDPGGKISRYFYGTAFPSGDMKLALVEAGQGKIGSLADRIILRCYAYNPMTGKYGFAVIVALRIGAVLTLVALAAAMWLLTRRARRRAAVLAATPPTADPETGGPA
jgi:protein SCO1/2